MKKLIVLDPGHGGKDPGAVGHGLQEKDINLKLTLIAGETLVKEYDGVEVQYTRKDDTFVGLSERANIANNLKADYFASFHSNALNGLVGGFQTYIHSNASQASKDAQEIIHSELKKFYALHGRRDAGKLGANFAVLRETKMPAIMFENLFIDFKDDNDFLKDPVKVDSLGKACGRAIAKAMNLSKKPEPQPQPEPVITRIPVLYRVQVGAFSKYENALKLVEELKAQGIQAYIYVG